MGWAPAVPLMYCALFVMTERLESCKGSLTGTLSYLLAVEESREVLSMSERLNWVAVGWFDFFKSVKWAAMS